ncbi:PR domain zinc finger protein 14 [Fasciola hepatica]|uniref:PR domain zinc finger protein 14 n=1 Tax=Fasciola hepatica TaxID=6192 RepID=A0A4E0RD51_FASHE|nr:PR domain zinc finger protein 14 [Fasciola hepatica]
MHPANALPLITQLGTESLGDLTNGTFDVNSLIQPGGDLWCPEERGKWPLGSLQSLSSRMTDRVRFNRTVESAANLATNTTSALSFPMLAIGKIPPPPPDVLLAALSYGRTINNNNNNNNSSSNDNNNYISSPISNTNIGRDAVHKTAFPSISNTPGMVPDEKLLGIEFWFRWLMQRSSEYMDSQTTSQNTDVTDACDWLTESRTQTSTGEHISGNANYSTIFANLDRFTVKPEPNPEIRMNPGPDVDPHISLHRSPDSMDVKVICRSPIPEGHMFGPISPIDFVHSGYHHLPCGAISTSVLSLSWMTLVRGAQIRSGDDRLLQVNLFPLYYSADQLAFMCRHGLIRPNGHINPSYGLVYFRATRYILPGEELILHGRPNAKAHFEVPVPSETHQSFESGAENTLPPRYFDDKKPIDPIVRSNTDHSTPTDTSISKIIHRLFSVAAQNGSESIRMAKNLTKNLQSGCFLPQSDPVLAPEEWHEQVKQQADPVNAKTRTTLTERFVNVPNDPQFIRSGMDSFSSERHPLPVTPSSSGNRCFEVTANQLRPAHTMEPEENGRGYSCEYCGKMFAYQYYRDKHLKYTRCVDQGNRKYPCKLCSRSFEKRDRLRIHVLHVHEKRRPHKCHLCEKSFSQSSSLNKHLRVHSGERPYKCCYCNKAFTASSILRTHIRQHSGEKPFKCKFCWKPFASHAAHDSHVRRTHSDLLKSVTGTENRISNELVKSTCTHDDWRRRGNLEDGTQPAEVDASTSSNESIAFTMR